MKDERGLYYYPFAANKRVRMYVTESAGEIWFRLWHADTPELWEEHEWVPYGAIRAAATLYQGKSKFNPDKAYDPELAKILLKESKSE